jgi:hypothetical protein
MKPKDNWRERERMNIKSGRMEIIALLMENLMVIPARQNNLMPYMTRIPELQRV